jgi:hypothetical protein
VPRARCTILLIYIEGGGNFRRRRAIFYGNFGMGCYKQKTNSNRRQQATGAKTLKPQAKKGEEARASGLWAGARARPSAGLRAHALDLDLDRARAARTRNRPPGRCRCGLRVVGGGPQTNALARYPGPHQHAGALMPCWLLGCLGCWLLDLDLGASWTPDPRCAQRSHRSRGPAGDGDAVAVVVVGVCAGGNCPPPTLPTTHHHYQAPPCHPLPFPAAASCSWGPLGLSRCGPMRPGAAPYGPMRPGAARCSPHAAPHAASCGQVRPGAAPCGPNEVARFE